MHAEQAFPASPTSPRDARRFVVDTLVRWGQGELADAAALLVTEVVTNAVLHARTSLRVAVAPDDDGVRVHVSDGSSLVPTPRTHGLDATTGRGLQLVAAMASAWGIDPMPQGKSVWFVLSARDIDPEELLDMWTVDDGVTTA